MLQKLTKLTNTISLSSIHHHQIIKLSLRNTQATQEWKDRLASSHKTMDTKDTESLYDDWASSYDDCLEEWGYKVPRITADLLNKYFSIDINNRNKVKVFDLGCGTGLVGKEIMNLNNNFEIYGSDLSSGQFPMAKEKGYINLESWNLNEFPYPYPENKFDILTCCGTLIYGEDKLKVFNEWCRITKPGSIIICSHRTDLMKQDLQYFQQMEKDEKWTQLELTDSVPYLPNNENYGMDIKVQFYVAKNEKKE